MEDIPAERQLIPGAVDYRSENDPNRPYAVLPNGDSLRDGFFTLTYRDLAKAVDATAWWLDDVLGETPTAESFPTIPYVGMNDFRYVLLLMALLKTGRTVRVSALQRRADSNLQDR